MTHIDHSIRVHRPQADVFKFVTNFENDHKWWKAVVRTEKLTPGDIRIGAEFRQVSKVMGIFTVNSLLKVTEYSPYDYVRYTNESPQLPFSLLYRFEPADGGTIFHLEANLDPKGPLKWLFPLLMRSLRGELQQYFQLLKTYMETPSP